MKLEDQVVSLELAKKLKELGFKQESLFWWVTNTIGGDVLLTEGDTFVAESAIGTKKVRETFTFSTEGIKEKFYISAYTVAELGEMLPRFQNLPYQGNGCWVFADTNEIIIAEITEADARAKMLIYLAENKLLTPATMNEKRQEEPINFKN